MSHVYLEPHHVISKRNADQPLRIKVFYDESVKKIPIEKFLIINVSLSRSHKESFEESFIDLIESVQNTILPQALHYWERALYVKPLHVPIRLNRYKVVFNMISSDI